MVFDAQEARCRFGDSHTTVVLWQRFEVAHRQMFDSLDAALVFLRNNMFRPTRIELHIHRGGHDIWITGEELAQLVEMQTEPEA